MRRLFQLYLLFIFTFAVSAAPVFAAPQAKSAAKVKDWTVMVFINGKNDLASFAFSDVNEMEKIGSTDRVNVVAEVGHMKSEDPHGGLILPDSVSWTGSRRLYITKDDNMRVIKSIMFNVGSGDMGDWRRLVDFVIWAKLTFPAKHYALVVWNHGNGVRGISYDDVTNHNFTVAQLGRAMASIGKIDVYASDACLMQMAEVAYEIKDYAPVIVGGEEVVPGDGQDYMAFLAKLAVNPSATGEDVGVMMVDSFERYYKMTGTDVTLSAVRSEPLADLSDLLSRWVKAVVEAGDSAPVAKAYREVQRFETSDYVDLYHFVQLVTKYSSATEVGNLGQQLMTMIKSRVVIANAASEPTYGNAHGLSIFFPGKQGFAKGYGNLKMSKDGKWDEFVSMFVKKPSGIIVQPKQIILP